MPRLAALLLIVLAAPAASAAAAPRCTLPGARTEAADAQARVFSVPGRGATVRRYFGCRIGHRPLLLTSDRQPRSSDETHVKTSLVRLAGTWVGWHSRSVSDFGVGEFAETVEVRSLAGASRSLSIAVTGRPLTRLDILGDGTVGLVLSIGDYREIDAVAHDASTPTPLAYTRGIDSDSVRFTPAAVSWTQNGAPRSVPLTAPAAPPRSDAVGPQALDGRFGDCGTLVPAAPKPGASTAATQLARAPGGALIAAGTTSSGRGDPVLQDEFVVARVTPDGRLDPGFGTGGIVQVDVPRTSGDQNAELTDVLAQPDGKVVVAGFVRRSDPRLARAVLYRFDADGALDPTFGTGGVVADAVPAASSADIRALALDSTGGLLVAGQRDERFYVARFTAAGAVDTAFGSGGMAVAPGTDTSAAQALAVTADGTIFAGGQVASEPMLVRFDADGTPLSGNYQAPPAAAGITALADLPGGGVMAAGTASNVVATGQLFLARYGPAGTPDPAFGAGGFVLDPQVSDPHGIAVAADGSLVTSADFFLRPGGYSGSGLVRYSAAGARDAAFGLRGVLGGVSSRGLADGDVLLDEPAGTALVAQENGGAFAVSRFALASPATAAVAGEPSVCAMATQSRRAALVAARKLGVSLRLRAPGRLRLRAAVSAGRRTALLGQVTVLRPVVEGAVVTVPLSDAAARLLRSAATARLTITAGAPGGATTSYSVTLR